MINRLWRGFCGGVLGHRTEQVLGEVNIHLFVRNDFEVTLKGVMVTGRLVTNSKITRDCKWCGAREVTEGFVTTLSFKGINLGRTSETLTLEDQLTRFQEAFKADDKVALRYAFTDEDRARIDMDTWVAALLAGGPICTYGRACTIVEDDYVHCD